MKENLIIILSVFICNLSVQAQNISDLLGGDQELARIFVNPLGLDNAVDNTDFNLLTGEFDKLAIAYKALNVNGNGNAISVEPKGMDIGGVEIDNLLIYIQDDMNCLTYKSVQGDNYREMFEYLNKTLPKYAINDGGSMSTNDNIKVYMLSDKYGIGVMAMDRQKTTLAMLMDMRDLNSFINMATMALMSRPTNQ